jgi:peptide-methionine (S)-S-oxide reductase
VLRTRVGYAGGTKKDPTYHSLGDHTETLQVDYDPRLVSYADLLEVFWKSHDPTVGAWSQQYMSAVFYANEEQKKLAEASKGPLSRRLNKPILTQILPLDQFYLAEGYHQKHSLRQDKDILREFAVIYPREADLVNSTAAARVNGYLSGYGTAEKLEEEIDRLGLSAASSERLRTAVKLRRSGSGLLRILRTHAVI